jgi:hypothetical protein
MKKLLWILQLGLSDFIQKKEEELQPPQSFNDWCPFKSCRVMDRLPGVRIAFVGDGPYRYAVPHAL